MKHITIITIVLLLMVGAAVQAQATAPKITTQPLPAMVDAGQSATFTVVATGTATLIYQWKYSTNGGVNWTAITGATSPSYVTAPTTISNSGTQYQCVVTNAAGGVSSTAVTLIVMPEPVCAPMLTSSYYVNVKNAPFNATGNGSTDDTAAIQAAVNNVLAHGSGTVYVPDGTYMINAVSRVLLGSNMTLYMSPGAILKVIPNNQDMYIVLNIGESLMSNVNVIGGTLLGDKYTHTGTTGEMGLGIALTGDTNNVVIEGVTSMEMWGDGFFMTTTSTDQTNSNITMCNDIASDNRRQGMSIEQANGVKVMNSTFTGTSGTAPQAGIDIEPDTGETVNNVQITNSLFEYNNNSGIRMIQYTSGSTISNVLVNANYFSGNVGGLTIYNPSNGKITISNNTIEDSNVFGVSFDWLSTGSQNIVTGNTFTYSGGAAYGIINSGNTGNIVTPNTCNGRACSCTNGISC